MKNVSRLISKVHRDSLETRKIQRINVMQPEEASPDEKDHERT